MTAQMIDAGLCKPCDVIRTFGVSKSGVDRALYKLREGGVEAFFEHSGSSRNATVMTREVLDKAQDLLNQGMGKRDVADDLGVKYDTLRRAIWDGRLSKNEPPFCASTKSERSVEDAKAAEGTGTACTRKGERILAAMGEIAGATTRFQSCRDVPCGGVLCALPSLLANGLLSGVEECLGKIRGYYASVQILLLLAYMSLRRVKTVESSRGEAPGEFGNLMGLDRVPEVRCLRGKMKELGKDDQAEKWAAHLARQWMDAESESVGALYIDAHVRLYHGGKTRLPRKYVSRERLCLRGTTDYWINDAIGRPFFVIDKVIDPGLIKTLSEDFVPRLLEDVPNQPTDEETQADPHLSRFILVFDREGYSPVFFRQMWNDHRIACVTYHKFPSAPWPESRFVEQYVLMPGGATNRMKLAERGSLVGTGANAIWMKEARKLTPNGRQTSLISAAYGLDHLQLATRMFTRWCQENFFQYMMRHFAIDLLGEYGFEGFHDAEIVINPAWRELNRERNRLQSKLRHRRARFAEMTLNAAAPEDRKRFEKWQLRKAHLLEEIEQYQSNLDGIKTDLKQTDKHIEFGQLPEQDRFKKPLIGRKRLMDAVRMIAYRAETAMALEATRAGIELPAARRILQDLFTTEADIHSEPEKNRLRICVHRGARPAVDRALENLFQKLNDAQIQFPATEMRVCYELVGAEKNPAVSQNGVNDSSQR